MMAQKDREKWDKKYTEMADLLAPRPPSEMVSLYYKEAPGKQALDLACGSGRHAIFLSKKGFHVDAVDISPIALEQLAKASNTESITTIEADLDDLELQPEHYDLIVKTNYLDRKLIERAKTALKPGGIFILETYVADEENEKKDANPDFLLQEGELHAFFTDDFVMLEHKTFWNVKYEKNRMKKEAITVQKFV
jgi:SAM-dependent methyltransferase